MKFNLTIIFILTIAVQIGSAQKQTQTTFIHPGMMQNQSQLAEMKRAVMAGKQPWKAAFDKLKKDVSIDYTVQPVAHLSQGAYGAGDRGGRALQRSAGMAYNAALLWSVTGDHAYANLAIKILNGWSTDLWDLDGNNAKLLAGLSGHYLLNAAEILKYSNSGWQTADVNKFKHFMLSVYYPLIKDFFPEANGNWDGSMINTMLCIGIFCDDHIIFNRAVEHYLRGNGNGGITKYIYPGGQIQEATRDWSHVQLGLGEFAKAAQTAWTQGIDLYQVADNRLAIGFEYASKYLSGEEVPIYGTISTRERQSLRDIYENIYNHYHFYSHLEMPYTARMIKRTRPESSQVMLISIIEAQQEPVNLIKMQEPGTVSHQAGAVNAGTNLNANDIKIQPGDSIQLAIDRCPKGGRIVLLKGIHSLKSPLRLPSDITLTGEGKESILFLSPELKDAAITNKSATIQNVVLSDFLLEGAMKTTESEDPNDNRRTRSYQHAAPRAGIVFYGQRDSLMKNLNFIRLTVQNFTRDGVMITGATNIIISACNISDNGASVAPGPGLHHNVSLSHVSNVQIKDSRFDTSLWGCGLHITEASDIVIAGNEASRNKLDGIYCGDVKNVAVNQNLTEGNDGNGIGVKTVFYGSTGTISQNKSQNNGISGLTLSKKIKLSGNTFYNNASEIKYDTNDK